MSIEPDKLQEWLVEFRAAAEPACNLTSQITPTDLEPNLNDLNAFPSTAARDTLRVFTGMVRQDLLTNIQSIFKTYAESGPEELYRIAQERNYRTAREFVFASMADPSVDDYYSEPQRRGFAIRQIAPILGERLGLNHLNKESRTFILDYYANRYVDYLARAKSFFRTAAFSLLESNDFEHAVAAGRQAITPLTEAEAMRAQGETRLPPSRESIRVPRYIRRILNGPRK